MFSLNQLRSFLTTRSPFVDAQESKMRLSEALRTIDELKKNVSSTLPGLSIKQSFALTPSHLSFA